MFTIFIGIKQVFRLLGIRDEHGLIYHNAGCLHIISPAILLL